MGRRKIEIKAIKDDRNRSVTFLKRKGGLFKKAHELAVLCSVDVAVIIFGHNKKLHQYSSSDMPQLLGQYQYFGPPHESKGPDDYNKQDGDDDDEDHTPAPEEIQAQQVQQAHPVVPPHLHQQPGFQHINHAPSASPPIANGLPIRHGTPQSHGSRPNSRNHIRRVSSNLGPHQHQHGTPPPPGAPNGFYMSNPSMYNPNVHSAMNQHQPRPGQYAQYGHPPPGPQGTPPQGIAHPHGLPPQHPQQHPQQHQQQHPQQMPQQQHFQHPHAVASQQMGMPPGAHAPVPQVTQTYMADQGRGSMPPAFPADNHEHAAPENSDNTSGGFLKPEPGDSPPHSKSFTKRSIFTPIDDRGSVLAQHFMGGGNMYESQRPKQPIKTEKPREDSPANKPARIGVASEPPRTQSVSSIPEVKPLQRTNSAQFNKRPQLQLQIPSESSEHGDSATAESSSRDSTGNRTTPAKTGGDNPPPSGVVLPPPSPSAGAILSAGAHGPPNPFARPQPPQPPQPPSALGNGHTNGGSNNIETPISALPSRYVGDLLPSPSSFFPEWGFGRSGPDSSLLPSPLTFPTPAVQSGPSFAREDEQDKKRKEPDGGSQDDAGGKKPKT